ncbi:MAG TPA: DUF4389 domain-containing protein [Nocardioides sp.]|nr:DUF4389 domain-containing protein [Nocardioides sp.]
MGSADRHPVTLTGRLDPGVSRGLWLVKWLLVVPHAIVLFFLWAAVAVLSVVAWFAILVTGRYPRHVFDFNVGVLRWTWRVCFYAYSALGTDRYPPFTLADVPDYPARLDVTYPEHLSRGLVLVKSWLLAIPHFLVLGFFFGAGTADVGDPGRTWPASAGLVGLLVVIAAVVLLFTGRYPRPVFDLVLGMDRWGARVAAYVLLMTDTYPPFRLDQGGDDVGGPQPVVPAPTTATAATAPAARWTPLRIVGAGLGSVVLALGLVIGLAGGAVLFTDQQLRDDDGFLMSGGQRFDASSYAIVTDDVEMHGGSAIDAVVGKIRLTASGSDEPLFIGIAPAAQVDEYLTGVRHAELAEIRDGVPIYREVPGGAPEQAPTAALTWESSAVGSGTRTLTWEPEDGDWTVVLMNADGSPGVSAVVSAGATLPGLGWGAATLLVAAFLLLAAGLALLLTALPRPPATGAPGPRAPAPPPLSGAVP